MARFLTVNRNAAYLLPPSVDDWLPKDHLARFVVDIVEQLDLSALIRQYRGAGSAAYHPSVMLGLLIYGYATGVYSSRRIEAATVGAQTDFPCYARPRSAAIARHQLAICQ